MLGLLATTPLTGVESGLLYTALSVCAGATVVAVSVLRGRRRGRALHAMLFVAVIALALLLVAIGIREGHIPLLRRFQVLTATALALAVGALLVGRRLRAPLVPAATAPVLTLLVLFALLLVPHSTGVVDLRAGQILHVSLALLGFSFLAFAACIGALYIRQIRTLKHDPKAAVTSRGPSLRVLDRLNFVAAAVGFPLLALGALGGWIFLVSPTPDPQWWLDPTVLATLAGLIVYGLLFGTRLVLGWHGRRIALLSLFGFVVTVVGYFVAAWCTSASAFHA